MGSVLRNVVIGTYLALVPVAAMGQIGGAQPLANVKAAILAVDTAAGMLPAPLTLQRLRTVVELRLRSSGMVIFSLSDHVPPSTNPILVMVTTTVLPVTRGGMTTGYAFSIRAEALESVTVPRNGAWASAILWDDERLSVAPPNDAAADLEQDVNELVDELANKWLAANPRR